MDLTRDLKKGEVHNSDIDINCSWYVLNGPQVPGK